MGFIRGNMLPILLESKRKKFSGNVLLLGAPDIYFDASHFERMVKLADTEYDQSLPWIPSPKAEFAKKGYLDGITLFKKLGFDSVSVLDVSDFEGANIIFDLNKSKIADELRERFDLIIDHGTLEHVFHFPNAMNNIFQMLKQGGRVITCAPSNNYFDHGFYMFQPTLFMDYYSANNWRIESIKIVQFSPNQEIEPPFFADYEPGLFDSIGIGKMGDKLYTTVCIASKMHDTTGDAIPQQGWYVRRKDWVV